MPEPTLVAIISTSFLVGLSGAVSPGPLLAYDLRESMRIGFWAGPLISLGHALLELLTVALLALGLARFFDQEDALMVVGIPGGTLLLWMAWGMVRHPAKALPKTTSHTLPYPGFQFVRPVIGGIFVSLANPFFTLWWLTAGATFLVWAQNLGLAGLTAFYFGHILSDFSWYTLVSAATASGRRWITPRIYQNLMIGCGLFLGGMGGWFLWSGLMVTARELSSKITEIGGP